MTEPQPGTRGQRPGSALAAPPRRSLTPSRQRRGSYREEPRLFSAPGATRTRNLLFSG